MVSELHLAEGLAASTWNLEQLERSIWRLHFRKETLQELEAQQLLMFFSPSDIQAPGSGIQASTNLRQAQTPNLASLIDIIVSRITDKQCRCTVEKGSKCLFGHIIDASNINVPPSLSYMSRHSLTKSPFLSVPPSALSCTPGRCPGGTRATPA